MATESPVPTTGPTATVAPSPTPTATLIPLSEIDLAQYLYEEGDLPAGVGVGQIRAPLGPDNLENAVNSIFRQFEYQGDGRGGVTVWVFATMEEALSTYAERQEEYANELSGEVIPDLGNAAWGSEPSVIGIGVPIGYLVFLRCNAVVNILMPGNNYLSELIAYGQRLDARLMPMVCQ